MRRLGGVGRFGGLGRLGGVRRLVEVGGWLKWEVGCSGEVG